LLLLLVAPRHWLLAHGRDASDPTQNLHREREKERICGAVSMSGIQGGDYGHRRASDSVAKFEPKKELGTSIGTNHP
jgi:hypothetical protein